MFDQRPGDLANLGTDAWILEVEHYEMQVWTSKRLFLSVSLTLGHFRPNTPASCVGKEFTNLPGKDWGNYRIESVVSIKSYVGISDYDSDWFEQKPNSDKIGKIYIILIFAYTWADELYEVIDFSPVLIFFL